MIAKSIYANTITTGNQKDSIILDDSYVDDIYLAGNDDNLTLVGNTTVNLANGGEGTNTLTINNPKTTEVNKTKNFFNIKGLFDDKNHFLSHFKFLENYKKPKSNIVENAINKLQELGAKVLTFNDGSQYNIFLSTKDETVEGTSSQDIIITTIGNSNAQEGDDIIIGKNVDASLFGPGDDIGIFNKAEFIDGESGKDALYAAKATMAKNIEKNHVGN